MSGFKRAVRSQRKLRMALYGASGSGKSYTALVIAKGLGEKIAVIDTEHASASLYAGTIAEFDTCELERYAPKDYVKAMEQAKDYDVLVIDSLSHAWMGEGGLLDQADKKGGSFGVWKDLTPQQNEMFEAMLSYPGHIIVTMRSKTEYQVTEYEKDGKKKTRVERVGLAPIQKKESEYEFDVVGQLDQDNVLHIVKSRFGGFDSDIRKPDASFARKLAEALSVGEPAPKPVERRNGSGPLPEASVDWERKVLDWTLALSVAESDASIDAVLKDYAASKPPQEIISRMGPIGRAARERVKNATAQA